MRKLTVYAYEDVSDSAGDYTSRHLWFTDDHDPHRYDCSGL